MAKIDFKTVDAYIGSQPEGVRSILEQVRGAIRKAVPQAEETISYGIPAYKLHDSLVLYFAAWKKHYSLYPVSDHVAAAIGSELAAHRVKKSTIQFLYTEAVPVALIERIARFRAAAASLSSAM